MRERNKINGRGIPDERTEPEIIILSHDEGISGLEGAKLTMRRKIGQFIATDENGRRYTILIFTNIIKASTFENPSVGVEGMKELKTFEGMAVNRLEKGKYQIVQTGIIVQSDSPDAP